MQEEFIVLAISAGLCVLERPKPQELFMKRFVFAAITAVVLWPLAQRGEAQQPVNEGNYTTNFTVQLTANVVTTIIATNKNFRQSLAIYPVTNIVHIVEAGNTNTISQLSTFAIGPAYGSTPSRIIWPGYFWSAPDMWRGAVVGWSSSNATVYVVEKRGNAP